MVRLPVTLVRIWSKSRAMPSASVAAFAFVEASDNASSSFFISVKSVARSSTDSTLPLRIEDSDRLGPQVQPIAVLLLRAKFHLVRRAVMQRQVQYFHRVRLVIGWTSASAYVLNNSSGKYPIR